MWNSLLFYYMKEIFLNILNENELVYANLKIFNKDIQSLMILLSLQPDDSIDNINNLTFINDSINERI